MSLECLSVFTSWEAAIPARPASSPPAATLHHSVRPARSNLRSWLNVAARSTMTVDGNSASGA